MGRKEFRESCVIQVPELKGMLKVDGEGEGVR